MDWGWSEVLICDTILDLLERKVIKPKTTDDDSTVIFDVRDSLKERGYELLTTRTVLTDMRWAEFFTYPWKINKPVVERYLDLKQYINMEIVNPERGLTKRFGWSPQHWAVHDAIREMLAAAGDDGIPAEQLVETVTVHCDVHTWTVRDVVRTLNGNAIQRPRLKIPHDYGYDVRANWYYVKGAKPSQGTPTGWYAS